MDLTLNRNQPAEARAASAAARSCLARTCSGPHLEGPRIITSILGFDLPEDIVFGPL
jgi:hypothetical protein